MKETDFSHPDRDAAGGVRSKMLVTTVRVAEGPGHDSVTVWNRGGNSGRLTVNRGDGAAIARLLIPGAIESPSPSHGSVLEPGYRPPGQREG